MFSYVHFGLEGLIAPVLYLGALVAFVLSITKSPSIGLYVLVPLLPLQTVRYRLHAYPLGHSFIDVMLLGVGIGLLIRGGCRATKIPLISLLLVIAVYSYLSLWKGAASLEIPAPLWFSDSRLANWKNNLVVPMVLYCLVFLAIRNTRQMRIMVLVICLCAVLFNRSISNVVGQRDYSSFSYEARADTGGIGSNGLAAYEVQLGFFLLGLFAIERRAVIRWSYFSVAGFCFYCVMYSFSRGGYVAFLVGWLFLGCVKVRKLLPILVGFLLVWQVLVPNAVRERVMMTYDSQSRELDDSANARVTVWDDAMAVVREDPVFGVGYDTYEFMHRVGGYTDTHNLYMKVVVETGIVGISLLLFLFWRLYRMGYRLFRSDDDPFLASLGLGFALWMVCAVITNVFGDRWNYIQINGYMWVFCAMVARGQGIVEQRQAVTEDGFAEAPLVAS